jgi:hypothetical protein
MTYAAYLRIYEPVAAFHEPGRSRWAAYAASSDRPRRADEGLPGPATRLHILASVWTAPLAWFVPFAATERWLALGPGATRPAAPQTASVTRALLYITSMSRARKRVARGLAALRGLPRGFAGATWDPTWAETELAEVGRWLEDFHPLLAGRAGTTEGWSSCSATTR